jgi:hypothetical protein
VRKIARLRDPTTFFYRGPAEDAVREDHASAAARHRGRQTIGDTSTRPIPVVASLKGGTRKSTADWCSLSRWSLVEPMRCRPS